ncbi:MAG: hypothetical protein ACREJ6_09865 [Candidatus Methylomirabilis sp.]
MRETTRLRSLSVGRLVCLLLVVAGPPASAAQIKAVPIKSEVEVLQGIKALRILMAEISATEGTHGVTREAMEAQVRKTLQEKLPALKLDPKAIAVLYFTVNLADFHSRLGYYGNLSVELKRPSMILVGKDFPDSPIQQYKTTLATVWAQGIILTGEVLAPTAVRKALDGLLDRFIADFREANP